MKGVQLALPEPVPPRRRGGKRVGAGRKRRVGARACVAHRCRPEHDIRHPVHVTLRVAKGLPSFRNERIYRAVEAAVRSTRRDDFRILEFSVQEDHIHTLVEAGAKSSLECGMKSLVARITKRVKKVLGVVRAKLWGDRYHRRDLTSPRQVRNALVYVLSNFKKHLRIEDGTPRIDLRSSAQWFRGWIQTRKLPEEPSPVEPPRTWLARVGWRKHGLIHPGEAPRAPR
ncbi:transposase [Labilithrix luteola]|uniref:transposase n=1 Tax=Labilithrix luteola TaxID=1391654 RepID=UPI0011BAA412